MAEMLAMHPAPDFAEVIAWNDAGESHYVGSVQPEGRLPQFAACAKDNFYDHTAAPSPNASLAPPASSRASSTSRSLTTLTASCATTATSSTVWRPARGTN